MKDQHPEITKEAAPPWSCYFWSRLLCCLENRETHAVVGCLCLVIVVCVGILAWWSLHYSGLNIVICYPKMSILARAISSSLTSAKSSTIVEASVSQPSANACVLSLLVSTSWSRVAPQLRPYCLCAWGQERG